jgi:hypothetical protein
VILSEKVVHLASRCDKNARMVNWFGENQGKSEKCRVEEKNRSVHESRCDKVKTGLSAPKLANEKTEKRRDFPAPWPRNVRRRSYCGNRG